MIVDFDQKQKLDRCMSAIEYLLQTHEDDLEHLSDNMEMAIDELRQSYRDATAVVADITEGRC